MSILDRFRENNDRRREGDAGDGGGAAAGGGQLDELRLAGQELLAAGAEAIGRTLSGDSEKFNAAVKQQGGE